MSCVPTTPGRPCLVREASVSCRKISAELARPAAPAARRYSAERRFARNGPARGALKRFICRRLCPRRRFSPG